ncbi:MAG: hypothetical protein JO248_03580 [Acidimicrobiia bacterium]|nr:hypothetical protein [Acidimicrobiia bacterium]
MPTKTDTNVEKAATSKPLTEVQARDLTERIRTAITEPFRLLKMARDGAAWAAMDYPSWESYCEAEFKMTARNARNVLVQAEVQLAIEAAVGDHSGSALPVVSQRQARALKPQLSKIAQRIRKKIDAGSPAVDAAIEVVATVKQANDQQDHDFIKEAALLLRRAVTTLQKADLSDSQWETLEPFMAEANKVAADLSDHA